MTNNPPIAAPYLQFWRSKIAICLMLAQRANQLAGAKNPNFLCTLAAAYAEAQYNTALADDIQTQLKLFQARVPFHSH